MPQNNIHARTLGLRFAVRVRVRVALAGAVLEVSRPRLARIAARNLFTKKRSDFEKKKRRYVQSVKSQFLF